MIVRTKHIKEKRNDLETNHSFWIPKNIQSQINDKWFAIYNWIWENDVKLSIERDFLRIINKFWNILAIVFIGLTTFLMYI